MAKILLVEDNEMNRDVLKRILTKRGYEVVTAEDGKEAVETFMKGGIDLVLMDVSLPIMDGHDATRLIRVFERRNGQHAPIIALTAHAMVTDRELAIAAGCDDFETKPVDLGRLFTKMETLLSGA